jgi:hypothetical protein
LDHVDAAGGKEMTGLGEAADHLPGRNPHRRAFPKTEVVVDGMGIEGFLQPVDVELRESGGAVSSHSEVPARSEVARHPPSLIGVHHQLEIRPNH